MESNFTSIQQLLKNKFLIPVPAEAPINLRISDITKNSVSLVWEKPGYDGGSPVTGYIIEKREGANAKWSKANLTNITDTRFTVTGLTQDETYEFRVMARNAVGSVSNPSMTAGPATCVDTYGKDFVLDLSKNIGFCFFFTFYSAEGMNILHSKVFPLAPVSL